MKPTVGIQKDRAKSLPDHSKTKITDSLKLNKKDLDVVSKTISTIGVSPCFLSEQGTRNTLYGTRKFIVMVGIFVFLQVTTAAATGGPQLTHLTKERVQAPKKRRPPRKFKPMDEDDVCHSIYYIIIIISSGAY